MEDIVDGSILKSYPLFSEKQNAFQIVLYTDEIELCNPLGSFASKNKLLIVYYTLANINLKYRPKLAAIRLLAKALSMWCKCNIEQNQRRQGCIVQWC